MSTRRQLELAEFEPLENSLLVLERSYDEANGASIMLYEAAPAGDRLEKQRLLTWDKWSLRDGNDEGIKPRNVARAWARAPFRAMGAGCRL